MGNEYEYIKLTDREHLNNIVRCRGEEWERFCNGEWKQTGILIKYFSDASPLYNCYEEISEEEALKIIKAS